MHIYTWYRVEGSAFCLVFCSTLAALVFHHTGVMFLDFAFLKRLGDLWDPLDSSL